MPKFNRTKIVAECIEDNPHNITRFAIIGDGSKTKLFGYTKITLFHDTHAFKIKCALIKTLPRTIIFGMDQLKKRKAMVNWQKDVISMLDDNTVMTSIQVSTTSSSGDGGKIANEATYQVRSNEMTYQVRCNEERVIPANCNMLVCANIKKYSNGEAMDSNLNGTQLLIEMDDKVRSKLPEGLWVARSLVSPDGEGDIQVGPINPTNDVLILKKGTRLATAHHLDTIALSMNTMSTSNLKIDEDGWLYLGGGKPGTSSTNSRNAESFSDSELRKDILKQVNPKLSDSMKEDLVNLIMEFKDLIPANPKKPPRTPLMRCKIENFEVVNTRQYRLAQTEAQKADEIVQEMLKDDIIRPSMSPYNSPIVMVTKKDGSVRFCVDFRKLNKVTKTQSYPMTNPYSCFDELGKAFCFTTLDLASAYWSVPMEEDDKEKTAFSTRSGKWEFNVMPFGLKGAVATFCTLMDLVFRGIQWEFVMCFVDDGLVYTPNSWKLHLHHIREALLRLRSANLSLKLTKCKFGYNEVPFLGHIIGKDGLKMDPAKVEAIQKIKQPTTKTNIRAFLALTGYYKHFVKNFAEIARLLMTLTGKEFPDKNILGMQIVRNLLSF